MIIGCKMKLVVYDFDEEDNETQIKIQSYLEELDVGYELEDGW